MKTAIEPDQVPIGQLARLFGVIPYTISRWVDLGDFPAPDTLNPPTWSAESLTVWMSPWITRVDNASQAIQPTCPLHPKMVRCPCCESEGSGDFALGLWTCVGGHYEVAQPTRNPSGGMNCAHCGQRLWLVRHAVIRRPG